MNPSSFGLSRPANRGQRFLPKWLSFSSHQYVSPMTRLRDREHERQIIQAIREVAERLAADLQNNGPTSRSIDGQISRSLVLRWRHNTAP